MKDILRWFWEIGSIITLSSDSSHRKECKSTLARAVNEIYIYHPSCHNIGYAQDAKGTLDVEF